MGEFVSATLDHLVCYVDDLEEAVGRHTRSLGLVVHSRGTVDGARVAAVGRRGIRLVLVEPPAAGHPGTDFVRRHGAGVAGIALRVPDAAAAVAEARRRGARVLVEPVRHGELVTATIDGFGDVTHTFVQRPDGGDERTLPHLGAVAPEPVASRGLVEIDHLAVCLEAGRLEPTVDFYRDVLDFDAIFTQRIEVGRQAMNSTVVRSRAGDTTLTLIEPDPTRAAGQIDEFLRRHGGPGVQHVAFSTADITATIDAMTGAGVEFLTAPPAYYRRLAERVRPSGHAFDELAARSILVDQDDHGQMFQIFARSVHPRGTYFVEVIERLRAQTFGSGNITALYEAVELQRSGLDPAA